MRLAEREYARRSDIDASSRAAPHVRISADRVGRLRGAGRRESIRRDARDCRTRLLRYTERFQVVTEKD